MAFNPKSLDNLAPKIDSSEKAREMQKNSVIARKANREARERLKLTAAEMKVDVQELTKDVSAIGALKVLLIKYIQEGELDEAAKIATTLAEFESPKLARVDAVNTEVSADELTDEELENKLKQLGLKE
jgi:RecA/RadA recombinase